MKYRKKPVVIEAFCLGKDVPPEWFVLRIKNGQAWYSGGDNWYYTIKTLEGDMRANEGDYVIKGIAGEIYPCKPDIFNLTYEQEHP